ncbi:MAG: acetate--CoA ligase family protein [Betaproteobacteria bacterium]|nr:acetate--CoA ligase family protein [Betaproteobacteria bacterium]
MSSKKLYAALFAPRAIALVGASGDPKKNTSRPQRFLRKHGYRGKIIPINRGRDEIFGEKAYPSLQAVPDAIDQAFIMVPADAVAEAVEQCAAKKVTVATIYSDGFAEIGPEGRRKQDAVLAIARAGGVRLIGPNCSGIFSSNPSYALSVNAVLERLEIKPGPLAIISQSGSMTGGLLSRGLGRGVGFSKAVSIGNECDLGVGEITDCIIDDPDTGAILLFLETIRDADQLAHAARRAVAAGKPVIVYKLGRSEVGQALAASHTGAMAGADEVADAFFRAHGMVRIDSLENLFELPALLAGHKPARRHRVAVMTTTGGGAATVVDRLGTLGVDVVPPSDKVIANLARKNINISKSRLTDLTLAGAKPEVYGAVINELFTSDHCDLVLAVAGSSAQFQPEIAIEPVIKTDRRGKPLAVFIAPHAEASLKLLADAGIAGFRTPESCADAIRAWAHWAMPATPPAVDAVKLKAAAQTLETMPGKQLNEYDACRVFAALGIAQVQTEIITKPEQKTNIGFPVVAKILSPDVLHKTDAGGVVLDIVNAGQLADAAKAILSRVDAKHPTAKINGILVQRMEKGLAEVIVGFRRDPQVGPIVVLGVGGVLAEIYKDIAIRLAPVGIEDARAMIGQVRGLAVIRGYRGLPRGDCDALAQAIVAMSQLAALKEHTVAEAEINPLIVKPEGEGVVAVDGLIVLRKD